MTIRWFGLVAPEGVPTADRRMFKAQALEYREFPLFAAWQRVSGQGGHAGSVAVGSWDRQYAGEGGIWGEGTFLDPRIVPEVLEAMHLLEKRIIGPSVDLDPDLTYEIVDHPTQEGQFAMQVTKATVHGLTFVMGPAFPQVHITVDDDEEMAILASAGISSEFAVNSTAWRRWPIAARETEFDADDAIARIAQWSGGDPAKFAQAFLYQNKDEPPNNRESYRLPIGDIHNGRLTLIPRAVFSAGTILSGAHGGLEGSVPEPERIKLQQAVTEIYDVLREEYGDPRVIAPWQRGGREGATSSQASLEDVEVFTLTDEDSDFAVRTGGWSSMPTSTGAWDEGAARRALDAWAGEDMAKYGRAFLWSDGSGNKTGFKFPIAKPVDGTLTLFIRAVNNADARLNQADIPAADKAKIQGILDRIQARYSGGENEAALMSANTFATANAVNPPATSFANPKFTKATPIRVDDHGRVFGHLASWRKCHMGIGNRCVMAPKSKTNYSYFRLGEVLCDDGSLVKVGKITLGTGHADEKFGVIPATEHYDNTGTCVAVVSAGEDKFGVWVSGALVAGVTEDRVAELRRSPLSGDWRRVDNNLELVAALAVNSPGFPVLHSDDGGAYSLLAAGMLEYPESQDVEHSHFTSVFDGVDGFLANIARQERAERVTAAFNDLPPVSDCGCNQ